MILWNCSKILIRLGQGCMTNCNGCNERFKKRKYFDTKDLQSAIVRASEIFSKEVRFFLFWQDPFFFADVETIMDTIRAVNNNEICIHISDIDNYDSKTLIQIESILQKYQNIGFYISTSSQTIATWQQKNIVHICTLLKRYQYEPFVQIYYDDISELKSINVSLFYHLLSRDHISATQNIVINHESKTVSDHESDCKFHRTIQSDNSKITFTPPRLDDFEFEVTYSGDIIPHTPRCYMAKIYISNVYLDEEIIYDNFLKFTQFINTTNSRYDSFEKNCYSCIFGGNSFDYKKLWT
jgi:hypothetical protein